MVTLDSKKKLKQTYSWILIFFILVGVISGIYLVDKRIQIEQAQNHIENIVNYDAIVRSIKFEKKSRAEVMTELKKSGVTAMAIYDVTLKKLSEDGKIQVLHGSETNHLTFYDYKGTSIPGKTYILGIPGKEAYFQETWEALNHRLGVDKVQLRQTNQGIALELSPPYEALLDMNLALSRLQAEEVAKEGFNIIIRPTNFANETQNDVAFTLDRMEGIPNITGIVFVGKEVLGYPNDISYTVKRLNAMHIPIVGIEATTQLQYEPQAGFLTMAQMEHNSVGRLYTIPDDYLKKLEPDKVSQMFFISDMERNVRYNLFNLYKTGKDNETALGTSMSYMKVVKEKLEKRGFILGRASIYPNYQPSFIPLACSMLGAIALFVFTVNLLIPMKQYKQFTIFVFLTFITFILYFLYNSVFIRQIIGLSTAIMAPVCALTVVMTLWQCKFNKPKSKPVTAVAEAVGYVVLTALIASIGGIYIGAILGSTDFFMEFTIFRGVKLTFVLPIILAIIAYIRRFPVWHNSPVDNWQKAKLYVQEILQSKVSVLTILVLGGILFTAYVFVGRSGHTAGVPVPNIELKLRYFLENVMYARPREKEFMIGYPALILAGYGMQQKWPISIHWILTIVSMIGVGSMVETFAHIRTPIWMSIMRGFDGLWLGILVGLVGLIIIVILKKLLTYFLQNKEERYD